MAFADSLEGDDQSAAFLRHAPAAELVSKFPFFAIPGVVDGKVLTESVGTALAARPVRARADPQRVQPRRGGDLRRLAAGRQRRLVRARSADVTRRELPGEDRLHPRRARGAGGGDRRRVPARARTPHRRPRSARSSADANFACHGVPAGQVDRRSGCRRSPTSSTTTRRPRGSRRRSTRRWRRTGPSSPTCSTCPTPSLQEPFSPEQEQLADTMRAAWVNFAASGNPSSRDAALAVVQPTAGG